MFDAGVHSFYLLRWMVGEMKSVQATTMTFFKDLYQDVEDNAMGTIRFVNGAIANFSLSNTTEAPWTETTGNIRHQRIYHRRHAFGETDPGVFDQE